MRQTAPPSQRQQPPAVNSHGKHSPHTKTWPPAAKRKSRQTVKPAASATPLPTPEEARHKPRRNAPSRSHRSHAPAARAAGEGHPHAHARRRPSRMTGISATFPPMRAAAGNQQRCQTPHPSKHKQLSVANACGKRHPLSHRQLPADHASSRLQSKLTESATPLPAPAAASRQRLRPEPLSH